MAANLPKPPILLTPKPCRSLRLSQRRLADGTLVAYRTCGGPIGGDTVLCNFRRGRIGARLGCVLANSFALGRPYFYGDGDGYTKFLYPRIVFTVVAIFVMFLTAGKEGANAAVFLCGAGVFLFSLSYAAYRYLMGE